MPSYPVQFSVLGTDMTPEVLVNGAAGTATTATAAIQDTDDATYIQKGFVSGYNRPGLALVAPTPVIPSTELAVGCRWKARVSSGILSAPLYCGLSSGGAWAWSGLIDMSYRKAPTDLSALGLWFFSVMPQHSYIIATIGNNTTAPIDADKIHKLMAEVYTIKKPVVSSIGTLTVTDTSAVVVPLTVTSQRDQWMEDAQAQTMVHVRLAVKSGSAVVASAYEDYVLNAIGVDTRTVSLELPLIDNGAYTLSAYAFIGGAVGDTVTGSLSLNVTPNAAPTVSVAGTDGDMLIALINVKRGAYGTGRSGAIATIQRSVDGGPWETLTDSLALPTTASESYIDHYPPSGSLEYRAMWRSTLSGAVIGGTWSAATPSVRFAPRWAFKVVEGSFYYVATPYFRTPQYDRKWDRGVFPVLGSDAQVAVFGDDWGSAVDVECMAADTGTIEVMEYIIAHNGPVAFYDLFRGMRFVSIVGCTSTPQGTARNPRRSYSLKLIDVKP